MNEVSLKTTPKEFFLHLLSMVTLYASAVSLTVILFQLVNLGVPDPLEQSWFRQGARDAIRLALSFLVVVFPVYFFTTAHLRKTYKKDELRRKVWIRKWLVYFTLFIAAIIIIGSLVVLMNTFLEGAITLRFLLKLLSVLFIAGSIFGFYLWDEKTYGEK